MPIIDHTADIAIYQMVRNRLPYIEDTPAMKTLISNFTYEVMAELEKCFKVGIVNPALVGHEENYSEAQKSIIADILAVYLILISAVANQQGTAAITGPGPAVPPSTTYIKKAQAGSVDVEYDQFDVKKMQGFGMDANALTTLYKKSAMRKARNLGCIIDICDDCSIAIQGYMTGLLKPFVTPSGGCDGCGA